jgi:hypothetical protein
MGPGAMINISSFIKIGPGIRKLIGRGINIRTHRQQSDLISLLYFVESRLKLAGLLGTQFHIEINGACDRPSQHMFFCLSLYSNNCWRGSQVPSCSSMLASHAAFSDLVSSKVNPSDAIQPSVRNSKFRGLSLKLLLIAILTSTLSYCSYKDVRANSGKLLTKLCSFSRPN